MTYLSHGYAQLPTIFDSQLAVGLYSRAYGNAASLGSLAWPAANRIYYVPLLIPAPVVALKMFLMGGTTPSGNIDLGIYDEAGKRSVNSGSTAVNGTTDSPTEIDITDTLLMPGRYFIAAQASATTVTARRSAPTQSGTPRAMGMLMESAGSFGLPATATFAAITDLFIPEFGFRAFVTTAL